MDLPYFENMPLHQATMGQVPVCWKCKGISLHSSTTALLPHLSKWTLTSPRLLLLFLQNGLQCYQSTTPACGVHGSSCTAGVGMELGVGERGGRIGIIGMCHRYWNANILAMIDDPVATWVKQSNCILYDSNAQAHFIN